jgi:hypothetical protein
LLTRLADRPHKTGKLPGDRGDGLLLAHAAAAHAGVATVKSLLRSPCDFFDGPQDTFTSFADGAAHGGAETIRAGRLHQDTADVTVTGSCDVAALPALAAGVLRLDLIHFRRHRTKGGYGVENGCREEAEARAQELLR